MKKRKTTVAVSVLTYNHEKFIEKTILSIIGQETDYTIKIFIADDHSTDRTAEICRKYQQQYPDLIEFESNSENKGAIDNWILNFNRCLDSGAGYLAICDGDDYWTDNLKIEKQVRFLEMNPDFGLVYSDQELIDDAGQQSPPHTYYLQRIKLYASGDIFWNLLDKNFINTSTVCMRTEPVRDFFPGTNAAKKHTWYLFDYWLWLMIGLKYKMKFFDEKMAAYRTHGQNMSSGNNFFNKRNALITIEAISKLKKTNIDTDQKKEIVTKKLVSILLSKKSDLNMKRKVLRLMVKFPPDILFVLNRTNSKYLKNNKVENE